MRLIDADALKAYWEEKVTFGECAKWEAQQIIDAIEYAPPRVYVDAVRCKDCKYSEPNDARDDQIVCRNDGCAWDKMGFCSDGERSER